MAELGRRSLPLCSSCASHMRPHIQRPPGLSWRRVAVERRRDEVRGPSTVRHVRRVMPTHVVLCCCGAYLRNRSAFRSRRYRGVLTVSVAILCSSYAKPTRIMQLQARDRRRVDTGPAHCCFDDGGGVATRQTPVCRGAAALLSVSHRP